MDVEIPSLIVSKMNLTNVEDFELAFCEMKEELDDVIQCLRENITENSPHSEERLEKLTDAEKDFDEQTEISREAYSRKCFKFPSKGSFTEEEWAKERKYPGGRGIILTPHYKSEGETKCGVDWSKPRIRTSKCLKLDKLDNYSYWRAKSEMYMRSKFKENLEKVESSRKNYKENIKKFASKVLTEKEISPKTSLSPLEDPKAFKTPNEMISVSESLCELQKIKTKFCRFVKKTFIDDLNLQIQQTNWRMTYKFKFILIKRGFVTGVGSNCHLNAFEELKEKYSKKKIFSILSNKFFENLDKEEENNNRINPENLLKSMYNTIYPELMKKTKNRISRLKLALVEEKNLIRILILVVLNGINFNKIGKDLGITSSTQKRLIRLLHYAR